MPVRIGRPPAGAPAALARALEAVVLDVLGDTTEPLDVEFSAWPAEDGHLQFVCRVEAAPADPFGGEIQWRWWSAILDDAEALHQSLSAAVSARRRVRTDGDGSVGSTPHDDPHPREG